MSDPKKNVDDLVELNVELNDVELNDLADDASQLNLDDLYQDAELEDLDDYNDADLQAAAPATAKGGERLWLVLTVLAFLLALLASLLLPKLVDTQTQRAVQANAIVDGVNATNNAASQALTSSGSFTLFESRNAELDQSISRFGQSNSGLDGLAASLFGNAAANQDLSQAYANYQSASTSFVANKDAIEEIRGMLSSLGISIDNTVNYSRDFVEAVAKEGRNASRGRDTNMYFFLTQEAANLNGLLIRLAGSVDDYLAPNANLAEVANRQSGWLNQLRETLNRLVGNTKAAANTAAEPLQAQYLDLDAQITEIAERAQLLAQTKTALTALDQRGSELSQSALAVAQPSQLLSSMRIAATWLPIILTVLGVFALWRYAKTQRGELSAGDTGLEETIADQQESILKLLDEMSALADGDLTVQAEVTDQITGAIADSVNFAVMEMRELVSQINRASIEVANESELAVNNAQSVSKSNMAQAEQISSTADLMQRVSASMREMSQQASSSSSMAAESIKAAEQGTQAVRDTIRGMEDMREQIQDTSKRIKRLGESSQRIGDIVALIDDIAEQTNILSLNAAIQASMAGEAGRGFAVVSDEVQSLAERSTEATKKIAELVTTIQNDTNDAVLSMEKATQEVVSGTKVADSAGSALAEIENVSQRLSGLIEGISNESNEQAEVVSKVSEEVTLISDSSTETSRNAQDSANSIAKLLELAKDLETSVSRFKLPVS